MAPLLGTIERTTETPIGNESNGVVAGDRTRVTRVTGGNTHHYTTTTLGYEIRALNAKNDYGS